LITDLTPELRHEIICELKKVRAPAKAARNPWLDIRVILPIADELAGTPHVVREEVFGGFGRPALEHYLVARKRAGETWDNTSEPIAAARTTYVAPSWPEGRVGV
jgi:hypothetical protein